MRRDETEDTNSQEEWKIESSTGRRFIPALQALKSQEETSDQGIPKFHFTIYLPVGKA